MKGGKPEYQQNIFRELTKDLNIELYGNEELFNNFQKIINNFDDEFTKYELIIENFKTMYKIIIETDINLEGEDLNLSLFDKSIKNSETQLLKFKNKLSNLNNKLHTNFKEILEEEEEFNFINKEFEKMISEFEILQTENAKQINLIIFNFYDKIFKSYHQMIIVTKKNKIINEKNIQEFAIDPLKTNNINIEQFRIKYKNIENKIENYKKIMEEGIKKYKIMRKTNH